MTTRRTWRGRIAMLLSTCAILLSSRYAIASDMKIVAVSYGDRYGVTVGTWSATANTAFSTTFAGMVAAPGSGDFYADAHGGYPQVHVRCPINVTGSAVSHFYVLGEYYNGVWSAWNYVGGGDSTHGVYTINNVNSGVSAQRWPVDFIATSTVPFFGRAHFQLQGWGGMTALSGAPCEMSMTEIYLSSESAVALQESTTPYLQAIIDQQKALLLATTNYQVVASSDLNVLISTQPAVDLVAAKIHAFVGNDSTLFMFGFLCAAFFVKGLASMLRS